LKPFAPVVPLQDGDVDCGLFLLQFAQSFFETPIQDYSDNFLLGKAGEDGLSAWFSPDSIDGKRKHIRDLVLKLAKSDQT
jgi:Ulp1 family protease